MRQESAPIRCGHLAILFVAACGAACGAAPPPSTAGIKVDLTTRHLKQRPLTGPTTRDVVELLLPSLARISTDTGLGSGFVVGDGLVATNLHVIAGASDAKVSIDGRDFPVAGVVGYHAERDLAILRIEGAGKLPVVRLRKTDSLLQGEKIVTLGNPLGLDATVSDGVLSAIRRYEDTGDTVLQISAPISPGSSGGPVADENGNVVGVSTFLLKGGQNLNFAVPADYLTELLAQPTTASLADLEKYAALFK